MPRGLATSVVLRAALGLIAAPWLTAAAATLLGAPAFRAASRLLVASGLVAAPALRVAPGLVTALALFTTSALAVGSDESTQRANERGDVVSHEIEVRLAEIEVVVTDRRGDPIAGLARENFEVFQDDRPVELTHFSAIPTAAVSTAAVSTAAVSTAAAKPLHLVIYVDRGFLEPGDLRDVLQALKVFLREALAPSDRVMLVTAARSLELRQAFTSLPELVVSKLDDVRELPGGSRLAREYQSLLRDMTRVKNEGHDLLTRDPVRAARTFVSRIQSYAAEVEGEVRQTTAQLQQLIQSIAGLPGRRAVLYVGGRVPASNGRRLFDAWEDAFGRSSSLQIADNPGGDDSGLGGGAGAGPGSSDPGLDSLAAASASSDLGAQRAIEEAAEAASAHGVVFHTLDAASQRDTSLLAPGDMVLPARGASARSGAVLAGGSLADATSSLRGLAWSTGGRSQAGGRNFAAALARIGSDLRAYYSLGFVPLPPKGESSRIEVRLRDAGNRDKHQVRHRSVLRFKDRDTLEAERTVSALLLEEMENPLSVAVEAGEPALAEDGAWRLPLSITVPLAKLALVADGRVHAGRLSIYTATGGLGRVGSVTKAVVPVRIPNRELLTSLGRRLAYQLELTLPAGRGFPGGGPVGHRVAVTVRDDFRPRSSTATAALGIEGTAGTAGYSDPGPR